MLGEWKRCIGCLVGVSKWDTSKIRNMAYMFKDCESLEVLENNNLDISRVIWMDNVFSGCKLLDVVKIGNMWV